MNKSFWQVLIIFVFLISACTPSKTNAPDAITQSVATTLSSLPTATQTASITLLPTIPTFTPTFDTSTIVTVTSAPKAECPPISQTPPKPISLGSYPSGQRYVDSPEPILDYLNQGGKLEELGKELGNANISYFIEDITNDGVSDLVIMNGASGIHQFVVLFWCAGGKYNYFPKDLAEAETLISDSIEDFSINDLNKNGVPEILSIGEGRVGLNVNLLEWNGKAFIDLTTSETRINADMTNASKDDFELRDINNNGVPELVLKGYPDNWYYPGEPLRNQIDTYYWNGKNYSPLTSFSFPQYRFQAIQDGDNLANQGKYDEAMKLYDDAINSKKS